MNIKAVLIFISIIGVVYIAICLLIYLKQDKLLFYPEKLALDYKYDFEGDFEELFINTDENVKINALHFKIHNPKGVILLLHGNAGSLRSWGIEGAEYERMGYDALIYDYRSFGKSTGPLSEEGFHKDVRTLYNYLKAFYDEDDIVIVGRSLGTGFAAKLASETNPRLLILITPYYSLNGLAKKFFPLLPVSLMLKYNLNTYSWLKEVKCPIFIFHGTKDEVIPYKESTKLQKFLKPHDELITVKDASHNNISSFEEYQNAMYRIL